MYSLLGTFTIRIKHDEKNDAMSSPDSNRWNEEYLDYKTG